MKKIFTILFASVVMSVSAQQLPNGGFENWASPLAPDSWTSLDAIFGMPLGLIAKDSVDKFQGSASLKLTSDSVAQAPQYGVLPGVASLGTGTIGAGGPSFKGIPFAYRPDTLFFAYKYNTLVTDTAILNLEFRTGGSSLLAGGIPLDPTPGVQWAYVGVPITGEYPNSNTPDTLLIQFVSSLEVAKKGSVLRVDAFRFGYVTVPTNINDVAEAVRVTVFPNPATDVLNITVGETLANNSRVAIIDANGRVVAETELNSTNNTIDVKNFATGMYTYRVMDTNNKVVAQNRFTVSK